MKGPSRSGKAILMYRMALRVAPILATALLLAACGSIIGANAYKPVHSHRTWSGPVDSLDLDVGNGSVTLVGSHQAGAVVRADGADGLTKPTNEQTLTGGTLRIRSSCGRVVIGTNRCSLSYRVRLPAGATVVAHTSDGRVSANSLTGSVTLTSSDGRISVNSPAGRVSAHSDDGQVRIIGATAKVVTASSRDGQVQVGFRQPPRSVTAHSNDGSVTLNSPAGTVSAHSDEGQVRITGATAKVVTASSEDGQIHVGFRQPPRSVTAHSNDGSVTIGVPDTSDSYKMDARSADGGVSTPVRTNPFTSRTITATSGDGSVIVRYGSAF